MPTEQEIFESTDERIKNNRMADAIVKVTDSSGNPITNAEVKIQQTKHSFLFGCNIFQLGQYKDDKMNETYEKEFSALLNYATLPFYWGSFEREKDKPNYERLDWMAKRCQELNITTKGHPLVWHETVPVWAPTDLTVLEDRLRNRVKDIVSHYAGLVDIWDVINEATVSARVDNPVGRWVKKYGDDVCVGLTLDWANSANPKATLLVNDFNISTSYEKQLEKLKSANKPFNAIGIQSHMHKGTWSFQRAWEVCETYKRFGVPLHFTELTVLSGHLKTDDDWHKYHQDWNSTAEGEKSQLEYVEKFYLLLFSHPAVFAITWWDFMDGGWQGAPAGLVRKDLSPKPIYERLMQMIKGEWWTQTTGQTNANGEFSFRGFLGTYNVTVQNSTESFTLAKGNNCWQVKL
ncbi:MAG: endo-1,4-beta-xylanase [Candidatus Poribacteria bacterium]